MLWGGMLLLLFILSACGNAGGNEPDVKVKESEQPTQAEVQVEESEKTVQYTTIKGEQVEIPAHPKRVVYIGPTLGDFLVMNIPIVGSNLVHADESYYKGRIEGIVDVGNPGDAEVILSLNPDLIINSYYNADAEQNEKLSKIAPTIPFNPSVPYAERVKEMGNIFGQQDEAAKLTAKFESQSKEMFDKLQLAEGETATVFYQLGKTLYVMGNRSLGAVIYGEHGFAVPPAVQENILDHKGVSFVEVSEEVLPEYAGDHLFVLVQDTDESKSESDRILQSPLWGTLPAVQKGNVYVVSSEWNTDGLLALEQLYKELPKWMQRS
ncbi:ABC transporter substrate-binding protein [Paenibacillus sp. NPDC057967]|uniref:ABC transporter substrate-binding protein n=1 Tax=Paenibacillus sp. NPDC057967 TaxID=3346293 RepID=UPI0036DE787F